MLRPASELSPSGVDDSLVVAGERAAEVVAFEREVVGFFVGVAELLGVPKSVAAIYGVIFASPEPLSFSDIHERLDFSRGSVSQGLRQLREIGAIREAQQSAEPLATRSEPDSRHQAQSSLLTSRSTRYEPDVEMRKLLSRFIKDRLQKQLDAGDARLEAVAKAMAGYTSEKKDVLQERVEKLRRWQKRTRALLPVIRTFLKLSK